MRVLALSVCGLAVFLGQPTRVDGQLSDRSAVTCGGYQAVPSGFSAGRATRLMIQKEGRVLATMSDWSVLAVSCEEVTGTPGPELLVRTFSGADHCCETVRAWTLADEPRLILEYAAGSAGGAQARDLDADGRPELLLGDDGLAHFGDLCYECSPFNIPLVACHGDGRFRDCTTAHPSVLREAMARFRSSLRPAAGRDELPYVRGAALGLLAVSLLLGEEKEALEIIRASTGDETLVAWLARVHPQLRVWAEARERKLKRIRS